MEVDVDDSMYCPDEHACVPAQQDLIQISSCEDAELNLPANLQLSQKRSKHSIDEPFIRLLIPTRVAGSIIGKGGRNISRIRNTYSASISVPDCPGPERIITISADYEISLKVIEDLIPNFEEFFRNSQRSKGGDELEVKLLVHQSQAGCVIGKGGVKVNDLREKTGAKIKIFGSCCPHSTDRVVAVTGSRLVCLNAVKEVIDLIKMTPVKGQVEYYDPHNFDELCTDDYGGYGSGSGGRSIKDTSNRRPSGVISGSQLRYPLSREQIPLSVSLIKGYPDCPLENMGCSETSKSECVVGDQAAVPETVCGQCMVGNGDGPYKVHGLLPASSIQISILKDLAGPIIGKSGSNIRRIRSESGAVINIGDPVPDSNDRIITISGTPEQIHMAQYLLEQSVHENIGNQF